MMVQSLPSAAVDPEQVYQSAVADMRAGRYAEACPKFAEARKLAPDSTPALHGMAQCYEKAGKWASAWTRYRELAVEMKAHGDDRAKAALDRAAELAKILSTVRIKVDAPDTPGLILRLDREEFPRAMFGTGVNVDPGDHILEATAPGFEVWQTHFTIGDHNDTREIQVPSLVAKLPVPPISPTATPAAVPFWGTPRLAGPAVGAAGVAGLAVGGILGGIALSKANSLKNGGHCTPDLSACDSVGMPLRQSAQGIAHGSTAGFVIGGAFLAAGVIVFATAPSASGSPTPPASGARWSVGPVAGAEMKGVRLQGEW